MNTKTLVVSEARAQNGMGHTGKVGIERIRLEGGKQGQPTE